MNDIKKNRNNLIINMTSYAIMQIVNMLIGLLLPRCYLAIYGSEINGIISTTNSFISYFSYLEAGIGLTLIHSLFKPLTENNAEQTNSILSFSQRQYQHISEIYLVLVVVLSLFFPLFSSSDALGRWEFASLVFVIGIYGALDFLTMAKYRVLLTADRKEYVISIAFIVAQLLHFCFVWLLLQFNISVVLVKSVPILTLLVRSLILMVYVKRNYPGVNYDVPLTHDLSLTGSRWDALLLQISINTSISLPTIIISQVLGFMEANVYAVYSMIALAVISIVSALSSGVAPKIGQSLSRGIDISELYKIYEFAISLIIAIVFSTMLIMMIPFIKLYTNVINDINYICPLYAIFISVWAALYSYRIPMTAVINAAGIYKESRTANIVNIVFQFVAGIVGGLFFGINGVLVVMIIASIQRNVWYGYITKKYLSHYDIKTNILFQCLILFIIIANGYYFINFMTQLTLSALQWIIVAFFVLLIEAMLCMALFIIMKYRLAKLALHKIIPAIPYLSPAD